jgi:hypothetical protein
MIDKEKILQKAAIGKDVWIASNSVHVIDKPSVLDAMEEYATLVAIDFHSFMSKNYYGKKATREHFQLYLNEKTTNKD